MSCCVEGSEGIERHLLPTAVEGMVESLVVGVTSLSRQKPACASMAGVALPGTMMCCPRIIAPLDLIDLQVKADPSHVEVFPHERSL